MALEDYKDVVGTAAGVCTVAQFFAGAFICRDIVKQGSTKNISVIPFLGGLVIGSLMMLYSLMLGDTTMITVNVSGIALNVLYVLCFYAYCDDRARFHAQALQGAGFVAMVLLYTRWEDPELVEFRFGLLVTVLLMVLIASPLFSLGEVIRTQSTASLPFPMISSGAVVSCLWLLYGIILGNTFLQIQNAVAVLLCAAQLSLFVIYPARQDKKQQ